MDWWQYSSDWTCERCSFLPTCEDLKWVPSWSLVLHSYHYCHRWLLVFTSDNFMYCNSGAEGLLVVLFWLDLWEIFFLPAPFGFEMVSTGSVVLHSNSCTSMTSGFHLWTISGIQLWYRGIGGSVVLIAHMRHVLFAHARIWTGAFWVSSSAFLEIALMPTGFCLWPFQVSNSGAEGLVVVLFWLFLWEISFCVHQDSNGDLWISSPALYPCAMVTSGFHLWQLHVFTSGAAGIGGGIFWLVLWGIFSLPSPEFEMMISGSLVLHFATAPW